VAGAALAVSVAFIVRWRARRDEDPRGRIIADANR
jgi:hypothetical protein